MCFYEQIVWSCRDFKWGNFREHCHKEYRIGETCGMKLVHSVDERRELCKLCEKLRIKERKIKTLTEKVTRWRKEGGKKSSIATALDDIADLEEEIRNIEDTRHSRNTNVGSGRRTFRGN